MGFGERLSNAATRVSATLDKAIEVKGTEARDARTQAFEMEKMRVQELMAQRLSEREHGQRVTEKGVQFGFDSNLGTQKAAMDAEAAKTKHGYEVEQLGISGKTQRDVAGLYAGARGGAGGSTAHSKAVSEALKAYDTSSKDLESGVDGPEAFQAAQQVAIQRYIAHGGDESGVPSLAAGLGLDPNLVMARVKTLRGSRGAPQPQGGQVEAVSTATAEPEPKAEVKPEPTDIDYQMDLRRKLEAVPKDLGQASGGGPGGGQAEVQPAPQPSAATAAPDQNVGGRKVPPRVQEQRNVKIAKLQADHDRFIQQQVARANMIRKSRGQPPITQLPEAKLAQLEKQLKKKIFDIQRNS